MPINPQFILNGILDGNMKASSAIGHPELYDALTTGKNGERLSFLGTSTKVKLGESLGVLSAVLYMMPAKSSGRESCAGRSAGCTAACLSEGTGRMVMGPVKRSKRRKHAAFFADRGRMLSDLCRDIAAHERRAIRLGLIPAVRANGVTDLPWHRMPVTYKSVSYPNIHAAFPNVQFYEYTKIPFGIQVKGGLPANLHLTFSLSERDDADDRASEYLKHGHNVAVVFGVKKHALPEHFTLNGVSYPVIDGDNHDARFLDPPASIVGLAMKGRAKTDTTGFTRKVAA